MGGAVSSGRDNNELIDNLMSGNYIRTSAVERVFRALDRADFMTPEARDQAYKDLAWRNGPLHLSSPCIYSEVMEGLELKPGLSFLNIGSGTGYLSTLAGLILGTAGISHGVEVHPAVVEYAVKKIKQFFENSSLLDDFDFCEPKYYHGNGLCLSQPLTGYDRVYCGAGCPQEYENYFKRLIKVGGILVMPLNDTLVQVRRVGAEKWTSRNLLNVSFATLRVPSAEDATNQVQLETQTPVRLQLLARAVIRAAMWRGVTRRNPILREKPRRAPPAACPRRICLPLEPGGSVEGLNLLHALDSENGANEMNALLSLVISMGQSRVAGALRFDRLTPSDSEDDDPDHQDQADRSDRSDHSDRSDRPDRPDRPDRSDRPDRPDRSDRPDRPDRADRPVHLNRSDRPNHPGRPDDPEHPDRPDSDHRDNNNQENNPQDHPNRVLINPLIEHFPTETDPGSRRVDINEPIILPSSDCCTYMGGIYSESDEEDSESDTMESTSSWNTYIKNNSDGTVRPSQLMDRHTARRINNATDKLHLRVITEHIRNTDASRPGDSNNTTIDTDASRLAADTETSGGMLKFSTFEKVVFDAASGELGNNDSRQRASSSNSTDENKSSNSRKSGRTRHLYGKSRDPLLMSLYENDTRPSTSYEKCKNCTDTRNPSETTPGEATDNIISQDPNSVPPRPDLPGMPSEVEIDLGKMAQTEATTSSSEMVWEETRPDSLEGSEDETDVPKSKPKRQKLDSGIGENTPSGSSPDKSKSSDSDSCLPSGSTEGADQPSRDMASDEDRFDTYDSHSNSESIVESDSPTDEELIEERSRSPSFYELGPEMLAHQARTRRRIARGGDARRARLSYLMKQAVRELPLPHALKKFVNLGRCFEF